MQFGTIINYKNILCQNQRHYIILYNLHIHQKTQVYDGVL